MYIDSQILISELWRGSVKKKNWNSPIQFRLG